MDKEGQRQRSLRTPSRERARTGRSRTRASAASRRRSRSSSRCRQLRDREEMLDKDEQHQRNSRTPCHKRARTGHSRTRASAASRCRSRTSSRQLREHVEVLELEEDLHRERDAEQLQRRSDNREPRVTREQRESHSRSRQPVNTSRDRATRRNSRSCSPAFSSKDVIQIIKTIKDILPSQSLTYSASTASKSIDYKNIIPEFNPSEKNQRVDVWIKKVNQCAEVYGWDENTTVHFAMQKLTGVAKTWYESLNSILFTWKEWQLKLSNAFPSEQNYGQLLEDMLRRKSKPNELIETYYYEKIVLLNRCDIVGKTAVDCIIHGISDRTTRTSALALRCEEPDQLLKFLLSNNNYFMAQHTTFVGDRQENRTNSGSRSSVLVCYNCQEQGHVIAQCTKPLLKCLSCNKVGHKAETCRINQNPGKSLMQSK